MTEAPYGPSIKQPADSDSRLGQHELAVLKVLVDNPGRVVSRLELARRAGISQFGQRRSDSLLVEIRRALDPDSIRTVRGRGWMLVDSARDRARDLLAKGSQPD